MIKSFNKIIKLKGEKVMEKDIKNIIKKIKQEVEKISSGETSGELYGTKSEEKLIEFARRIKNIKNIEENIVFEEQDGSAMTFNIETEKFQYFGSYLGSGIQINLGMLGFCEKISLKYVSDGKRKNKNQITRMEAFLKRFPEEQYISDKFLIKINR